MTEVREGQARVADSDRNGRIIEEFRVNGGDVGGPSAGTPLPVLHTVGARTGRAHATPLVHLALPDGGDAVFASNAGATRHPDWFHNLLADAHAHVETGSSTEPVAARIATGEERRRLWATPDTTTSALRRPSAPCPARDPRRHPRTAPDHSHDSEQP